MALIERDGLPFLKMGGFSMAGPVSHNQMVSSHSDACGQICDATLPAWRMMGFLNANLLNGGFHRKKTSKNMRKFWEIQPYSTLSMKK